MTDFDLLLDLYEYFYIYDTTRDQFMSLTENSYIVSAAVRHISDGEKFYTLQHIMFLGDIYDNVKSAITRDGVMIVSSENRTPNWEKYYTGRHVFNHDEDFL